ncbi:TIGR03545 family protein [Acetonema longum]|uniref:TIGR03545 family protein n=1 Tax=Acetonema longum DSM 6540 TaxID=1009370 RepID=F7NHB8_9FIRM|nr:TIGR03545 family protein [Acetonema longum]EGO64601.1 hypothetical protein ALO_07318 [Acetonema longum DSM 6540]
MRWKALYIILALTALFGVLGFFFLDSALGWTLERSIEAVTGVDAEVNGFRILWSQTAVEIDKVAVTNPSNTWRNLLEAKNLRAQIALEPLFSGKTVIEEINIDDLILNTPRSSDGKLEQALLPGPFGQAQSELHEGIAAIPMLDPGQMAGQVDVDQLVASHKFETDTAAAATGKQIEASKEKWQQNLTALEQTKKQIQEMESKLRNFKLDTSDPLVLKQQLDELKAMQETGKAAVRQISATRNELKQDFSSLTTNIKDLRQTADKDYHALLKMAKLPDASAFNISEALFGDFLLNQTTLFVGLADQIQTSIPVELNSPEKEEHVRGGQDIIFPGRQTYPQLLIKHIGISTQGVAGETDGYYAKGALDGFTTEPAVYGKPMNVSLQGQSPDKARLDLHGIINHTGPDYHDQIQVQIYNFSLPGLKLPDSPYLPQALTAGSGNVTTDISLRPDVFALTMTFTGSNITGSYAADEPVSAHSKDEIAKLIRQELGKLDQLYIKYQLEKIGQNIKMKVSSNLDDIIAGRFKAIVGETVNKYTDQIRSRVDARLEKQQQELEGKRQQYEQQLNGKVNETQALADKYQQEANAKKKQLEDKINAKAEAKKDQLEDKLKDKLKKLF